MGEEKKPTALEQQVAKLTSELADAWQQIRWMQTRGGFTDAKMHSMRATRIEERLEKVELDADMLKDVAAHSSTLIEDHLKDRHDADVDRDNSIDVVHWRKIRRRMREWAEKRGLMDKRRDTASARGDENRLRPRAATS